MPTIGELIINVSANTASFVTNLNKVKNLSFETSAAVQRSFSLISTAALGMVSVAAGAFAVGIQKTAEWEVSILHLAESAGTTTETMSGLAYAASMMGLQVDQVALAMERFDKNLLLIRSGSGSTSALKAVFAGIDPAQIKQSDDALKLIADRFNAMPDGANKSAQALTLFGRAGGAMIPLLERGGKGIQAFMDQAKAMGLIITKDQAEQAEKFEQNMTRMKESLRGAWLEITNATIPVLNDLIAKFGDAGKQGGGFAASIELQIAALKGFGQAMLGNISGSNAMAEYLKQGQAVIDQQEKLRPVVKTIADTWAENDKAIEEVKKSYDGLEASLTMQLDTLGKSATAVKIYEINAKAAAAGVAGLSAYQQSYLTNLASRLSVLKDIQVIDNQTKDEQKKLALEAKLKLEQDELVALTAQADVMARMATMPDHTLTGSVRAGPTEEFQAAYDELMTSIGHSIDVWGMTTDQVTRFNLAQKDGSPLARAMTEEVVAQSDKLQHLQTVTATWNEFTKLADRSLQDLIFSGKKFTQILADITKALGEMLLKMALFGAPGSSGGGLFGSLFSSLFGGLGGLGGGLADLSAPGLLGSGAVYAPLGGFAAGGTVSAGVPIMVGENGPEVFMPSTAGAIIPNGAGAGPQINIVYNIDARGSAITEEQFRRSLAESEGRAVQRALLMTREVQLRTA